MATSNTTVSDTLTDGTGISKLTSSKVFKDLVVDLLLSATVALAAVGITDIPRDTAQYSIAVYAIGGALIRVLYRSILRWASAT